MTYMKSNADPSLIGRIVVIVPAFRQWSGTRAMREQDYQVGQGGQLPPNLTFSQPPSGRLIF